MASPATNADVLANTILSIATDGYSPSSDELANTNLSAEHLPTILQHLETAKEDVKQQVRTISRDNATSIDSWIGQARQLHSDIEASKLQADEVLKLDMEEKALRESLNDAETQQQFLIDEIQFNETLTGMLEKLQLIGTTLTQVDVATNRGEYDQSITLLLNAEDALKKLQGFEGIIIVGLMKEKAKILRRELLEKVEDAWSGIIKVEARKESVTIRRHFEISSITVESETVVTALDKFNLLDAKVDGFHQHMDRLFIMPRLGTQQGKIPTITIDGVDQETIKVVNYNNDLRAARLFTDLRTIIEFLNDRLPAALMSKLSKILIPNLTSRLISTRLSLSIPSTLDDLPGFEELLEETKRFEDVIYRKEWTRERELSDWVERAPKVWLAKRRETSIDTTRKILAAGIGKVEIVERSETQTVEVTASEEALVSGIAEASGADEWNSTANKQENEKIPDAQSVKEEEKPVEPAGFLQDDEDDDAVDGWGLDEDIDMDDQPAEELEKKPESKPEPTAVPTVAAEPPAEEPENEDALPDDDEMDWGAWGDDDDELSVGVPSTTATNPRKKSISESKKPEAAKEILTSKEPVAPKDTTTVPETVKSQEITLTENYTITAIPTALISLISRLLSEANDLQINPKYASSPIAPAGKGILTIPTLILATFRALAPLHYTDGLKSHMYLYNDCTYLSSHLPEDISEKDRSKILTFGKRHYSQEMEAQRAIFLDYLDGAQGFAGCTSDALQRQECDAAIASTIYRLRELHLTWRTVLSKSALYQSIGMLLNTIVTKLVNDIEDLSDISEPESVRLAKYCGDIMDLEEELFMKVGMAQIYCATWTKFVFVRRILESSMVQIMGMVRDDGILKNVLTAEEIVELVKALFAESEIRKQCIDYVRRGGH